MAYETKELLDWNRLIAVGRVASTHGRRGEVAVDFLTDSPERFFSLDRVFMASGGTPVEYRVESVRIHKGRPLVKLSGISNIGEAESLRGGELRIPESDLEPLPPGDYYLFQIQGLPVVDRRMGELGTVENLLETGGTDVLVVRGEKGEETLVPLCGEIVKNIDLERRSIEIEAPEGLVHLNAN